MEVSQSTVNGWQVIHVAGQVDSKTVGTLRSYIDTELDGTRPVALDVKDVPFMSSAGLRTLLTLHRRTLEMGVELTLVALAKDIVDTMRVTGFYDYFTIKPDLSSLPQV